MIAPTVLLLSVGIRWWMCTASDVRSRLRPAVALLLAWGLLAGFGWYYFDRCVRPGESHVAFRTAAVEPKRDALRIM